MTTFWAHFFLILSIAYEYIGCFLVFSSILPSPWSILTTVAWSACLRWICKDEPIFRPINLDLKNVWILHVISSSWDQKRLIQMVALGLSQVPLIVAYLTLSPIRPKLPLKPRSILVFGVGHALWMSLLFWFSSARDVYPIISAATGLILIADSLVYRRLSIFLERQRQRYNGRTMEAQIACVQSFVPRAVGGAD